MQTQPNPLRRNRLANLLLEASPAAVVVTNRQGFIATMNHIAEKSFGYQEIELVGQSIERIFPAEARSDGSSHDMCVLSRLSDPDPTEVLFLQAQPKRGQTFPTHVTLHPLTTSAGDSCLANVFDLSRQTPHAINLEHQKRIQGERLAAVLEMVSGLSHKSRNALQRAQSCLELLQLDLVEHTDLMTLTDQIQLALKDIQQNYEEVRSYAAPITLTRTIVDLPKLCLATFEELVQPIDGDAPRLRLQCDAACKSVKLDANRIREVIRHVLENAIHATPANSVIELQCDCSTSANATMIEIRVRDQGEGMDVEVQQRLFEPFFTTKQQKNGLGLAVCRRIVEAHGGTIDATNTVDGGTKVQIIIPG